MELPACHHKSTCTALYWPKAFPVDSLSPSRHLGAQGQQLLLVPSSLHCRVPLPLVTRFSNPHIMKVSIRRFMASGREGALCPEECRTLCTVKTLSGHLYWPIMGDEPERKRMLCHPEHQIINLHH